MKTLPFHLICLPGLLAISAVGAETQCTPVLTRWTNQSHAAVLTHRNLYRCGGHFAFGDGLITRFPLNANGAPDGRSIPAGGIADGAALYEPAAVAAGDRLYVLGGKTQRRNQPDTEEARVWMFPIRADGSLEKPTDVGVMPETRHPWGTGAVAHGNRIYLAGGWGRRTCHTCEIKPDGTLTPWVEFAKLPTTLLAQKYFVLLGNTLYAAGPVGHNIKSEKIYACKLGPDGVPSGKWRRTTNLPNQTYFGTLVADGDALLYADGLTGKIFRARPDAEGELGDWTEAGELPRADVFGFSLTRVPAGLVLLGALTNPRPHRGLPGMLLQLPREVMP